MLASYARWYTFLPPQWSTIPPPLTDHLTGGIVHRDQQREWRRLVPQPRVMAAVHLDEHTLPGHALAAHPVLGRTPLSRTAQTDVDQDTPQGRPADFDALSFAQQLAEMRVVGLCILCEPDEPQQLQRSRASRWAPCGRGGRDQRRQLPPLGKPLTCAWCGVG